MRVGRRHMICARAHNDMLVVYTYHGLDPV